MKKVRYIGNKAQKRDTVAGTGFIWGKGEVLPVEDGAANRLLQYPTVWALVEDDAPALDGGLDDALTVDAEAKAEAKAAATKKPTARKPAAKPAEG